MLFTAGIIAVVIAVLAILGFRPRGGRRVANTQMMAVARVALGVVVVVVAFLVLRR